MKSSASALVRGLRGARQAVRDNRKARAEEFYCPTCGALTNGRRKARGSMGVELLLWMLFIVPGLIYSLWRMGSKQTVCGACEAPGLIPSTSPRARRELGR